VTITRPQARPQPQSQTEPELQNSSFTTTIRTVFMPHSYQEICFLVEVSIKSRCHAKLEVRMITKSSSHPSVQWVFSAQIEDVGCNGLSFNRTPDNPKKLNLYHEPVHL
jgi:hypothetical protein